MVSVDLDHLLVHAPYARDKKQARVLEDRSQRSLLLGSQLDGSVYLPDYEIVEKWFNVSAPKHVSGTAVKGDLSIADATSAELFGCELGD